MYHKCTLTSFSHIFFRTSDSQLNNFTRLEPVLHLLEIPFDTNVAREIMTEKTGTATRVMYQVSVKSMHIFMNDNVTEN